METREHAFSRLVRALQTLVEQEAAQIAARDYRGVVKTQQRATPVVARLAELGASAADADSLVRVAALMVRRQQSQDLLAVQIAQTGEALRRSSESKRRISQIAPAYGTAARAHAARRLCAVG